MIAVAAAAFAIGLVAIAPIVAAVPLILLAASLLVLDGRVRLPFLVFGGLAVLQSSQDLNLLKVLYLAGVVIAVAGSVMRLQRAPAAEGVIAVEARPLMLVSGLFVVLLGLSFPVAIYYGTSPDAWLRDGSAYLLFAAAIVVGVDAGASYSPRAIVRLLIVAGLISTLSFTVQWVGSGWRGLADLPLQRLVLSSFFLPAAIFTYASVRSVRVGIRALPWVACAGAVAALMLVTGTRSSLLLGIGPAAGLWFYRKSGHRVGARLLALGALFVIAILAALQFGAIGSGADTGRLLARFESIGSLYGHPGSDPSLLDRLAQTSAGLQSFFSAPITGVGAGHLFRWIDGLGRARESFILDAPTAFAAKFGIAGVVVAVVSAVLLIRWPGASASGVPVEAWIGFLAICSTWFLLFGSPWEDKGFSLAVALLIALLSRNPDGHHAHLLADAAPRLTLARAARGPSRA